MNYSSDLGSESHIVDGVLGALMFAGAEVEQNLAGSIHIRQRSAGDVDVTRTKIVQDESNVVTRVHQSAAHLYHHHHFILPKN